ncbi:MAG: adenosine deaminase [Spirochaetaceae bacterium 4572_59]|nr:MAG: adenosine deaminase [Spirochaetaceae bacterium 4572_59]
MDFQKLRSDKSQITKELVSVAMGQEAGDIIIRNGKLINVHTALIEDPCDVIIHKGFIAYVGNTENHPVSDDTKIIEAEGQYILPGLIDSHMHVESSMVDLPSFAAGILPHGTTTICPDIHEMTNVFGLKAVELFQETSENLPLKVFTAMPVCVPSIPGMEDAGAEINAEDVGEAYQKGWVELQGEQMNFPGVIFGDPAVHAIGAESLKRDGVMTGHYSSPDLKGGLNAFIAAGMTACHESTNASEALEKAKRGMYVQQRYGTAWLDLPNLVPAILENPGIDTRMFTLVTDDVTPLTISEEGQLIRVLREAVRLGINPIQAIQMVTLNAAQLLGKDRWIGSVAPGKAADILLVDNLKDLSIKLVISGGIIAAENGALKVEIKSYDYPAWALNSVHISEQKAEDFRLASSATEEQTVRAIRMIPGMVFTKEEHVSIMPEKGELKADPANDLAKICSLYRHEKFVPEQDRRSMGFVKGLFLDENTAYASTVSHDCHNLLIVGTADKEMALAANTLKNSGGGLVAVRKGEVLAHVPLPFGGLMSLKSVDEAGEDVKKIEQALIQIGCPHKSAEMTISLLALIVLPELHISNKGLVQLKEGQAPRFVPLIL